MPSPIPIADQLACVTRKLRIRLRIYPHLVRRGTMTQAQMDRKVACMQAVLVTLQPETPPDMFVTTAREEPQL